MNVIEALPTLRHGSNAAFSRTTELHTEACGLIRALRHAQTADAKPCPSSLVWPRLETSWQRDFFLQAFQPALLFLSAVGRLAEPLPILRGTWS